MAQEELSYVNYDFNYLMNQLQNRLKARGTWKDTYRSGTGQMLIELYAAVGNLALFYVERRAEESYIATAKNKSSVINLVRLLNYVPARNVSSSGTLEFSLSAPATRMVFVPKYTVCATNGGVKFLVSEDVVIMPGQSSVSAAAIQGELITLDYVSTGSLNQEYKLNDTEIENTNIFVYVNSVLWTRVTSFIDSTTTSMNYILRPELDDTLTLVFGDNVFGKSPSAGDEVQVKYVRSLGLSGNIYELGRITLLGSTIFDDQGTSIQTTVTNTTVFLGGDDAETIEDIRYQAPRVFATGDRAVTKEDFQAILEDYPGVANANAWGENEENPPNYNMFNQVKLVVLLQEWQLPDAAFKTVLSDYLYTKSLMTVRYSYVEPDVLQIIPILSVKCLRGTTLSYIESQIEAALNAQFELGTTARLGVSKRISDIVSAIEAVGGVSYSYTSLKVMKPLSKTYNLSYNWSQTLTAKPVLAGSVDVYLNDATKIGNDNGVGGWTTTSGYTLTGVMNYTTGLCGINISPALAPTDTLSVRYSQNSDGDISVTRNQICQLNSIVITSISYA